MNDEILADEAELLTAQACVMAGTEPSDALWPFLYLHLPIPLHPHLLNLLLLLLIALHAIPVITITANL